MMIRSLACGVLLLSLFGCDADEPCDAGFEFEGGACVPKAAPSAGRGGGDKAGEGGGDKAGTGAEENPADAAVLADSASNSCEEDRDAILNAECGDDGDCNCAAPYCAKMPGQAMGFCTVYCEPMPDDCPDGWMCFDLSVLGVSGFDPFCVMKK